MGFYEAQVSIVRELNRLVELHEDLLLNSYENDVQEFFVCRTTRDESERTRALKLDKKLSSSSNLPAVMFSSLSSEQDQNWQAVWYNGKTKQETTLVNSSTSLVTKFLDKFTHPRVPRCFHSTLIDLVNNERVFNRPIRTRLVKLVELYREISRVYGELGHLPLRDRYEKAIECLQEEAQSRQNSFVDYYKLEAADNHADRKTTKPTSRRREIGLLKPNSMSFLKQLNDKLTESELFGDILPRLDSIPEFESAFNDVYDLELIECGDPHDLDQTMNEWKRNYKEAREKVPYQRKFALVRVDCERVVHDLVDTTSPVPVRVCNSIEIEKKNASGKIKVYFVKDRQWLKSELSGEIVSEEIDRLDDEHRLCELSLKHRLVRW